MKFHKYHIWNSWTTWDPKVNSGLASCRFLGWILVSWLGSGASWDGLSPSTQHQSHRARFLFRLVTFLAKLGVAVFLKFKEAA